MTLKEFWPVYIREHRSELNRRVHFAGTALVISLVVAGILLREWRLIVALPFVGYGFAWFGHLFIEKNRPATFRHPAKSLACDFIMFYYMLTGQMKAQIHKHDRQNQN